VQKLAVVRTSFSDAFLIKTMAKGLVIEVGSARLAGFLSEGFCLMPHING
jgi:hypothetical protein